MRHPSGHFDRERQTLRVFVAAFIFLFVAAAPSWAADPVGPRTWWTEIGLGAVKVRQSGPLLEGQPPATADDVGGFLKFGFGHMVDAHLGLGLELGVGFLRAGGSGENAIELFSALVTARVYPFEKSPFHLRLAGGAVGRDDNNPSGPEGTSLGWEAGIGYDLRLTTNGHLTPYVLYQAGRPGGIETHTILFGASYGRW
jgi:hypothetical protein